MKKYILLFVKILFLLIFFIPIITIIYNSLLGFSLEWFYLLKNGAINTIQVLIGSIIVSLIIGLPSAIILGFYKIKYSKWFIWIFIISLILPGYTLALLYSDIFSFFFSKAGLIIILGISSSPYIFLSVYSSVINISNKYILTGKSLGLNDKQIIYKILLPLLKPSIIMGLIVVIAEVLSDFGASFFLGIDTLMVNIYNLYFSIYNTTTGSQFALILIFIIFLLFFLLKPFKKKINLFVNNKNDNSKILDNKNELHNGKTKLIIYLYLIIISSIIFIIPIIILLYWLYLSSHIQILSWEYISPLLNSILLIILSIGSINILGYLGLKLFRKQSYIMNSFTILYGLPGLLIGIALLGITPYVNTYFSSMLILILGLSIKIFPLVLNSLYIQYIKISPKLRKVWYSLGNNRFSYIHKIEIPLLMKGFIMSSSLIFIEIIRELPITLILKPFNFETLSTKIFFYQATEQIEYSSIIILFMICITIIPIIYIYRKKIKY